MFIAYKETDTYFWKRYCKIQGTLAMATMALLAPSLLKRKLILLSIVLLVVLSFSNLERVRPQEATPRHFLTLRSHSLPPRTTTYLPLYGSENISDNMIQALVLSPEKSIVVAIGTADVHEDNCPRPNYNRQNLTLSFGGEGFPVTRFNQFNFSAGGGAAVVAHFNVTDALWEKLRQSPFPLQVDNQLDQTTQQLTPMVDPALTQGWGQHKLSATVTVRKHYRFYKGRMTPKDRRQRRSVGIQSPYEV